MCSKQQPNPWPCGVTLKIVRATRTSRLMRLNWSCSMVAMLALVGCRSTPLPPDLSASSAQGYILHHPKSSVQSGVKFLSCNYEDRKNPFKPQIEITFWELPAPLRSSPKAEVKPVGNTTFIPMGQMYCPFDLSLAIAHMPDVLPEMAPQGLAEPVSTNTELDMAQFNRDIASGSPKEATTVYLRRLMTRQGAAMQALAAAAERSRTDAQEILASQKNYPANRIKSQMQVIQAALLRVMEMADGTFGGDPPRAVKDALTPITQIKNRLHFNEGGVDFIIRARVEMAQEQRMAQESALQVARRERNQAICAQTSKAADGKAPSEYDMCVATLRDMEERAEGFELSKRVVTNLLGVIGQYSMSQAGSLRPVLTSFTRKGRCTKENDFRDAYDCEYDAEFTYDKQGQLDELLKALLALGRNSVSAFYQDNSGTWAKDLTQSQMKAKARSDEADRHAAVELEAQQRKDNSRTMYERCGGRVKDSMFGPLCY
jgi:hypothetical protein